MNNSEQNADLLPSASIAQSNMLGEVSRKLGDYDIWYKPCKRCGYDTGKSSLPPKNENKRCWKCGDFVQRDFSDRALKK